ncbi:MAG: hypothetical protein ACLQU3_25395 [Limisphaerales bacterium]
MRHPGQTVNWYKQRCRFSIYGYLDTGRSVDSLKHRSSACTVDEPEQLDSAADDDIVQQICEQDVFDELTRHLEAPEQRTLGFLRKGMTVREIARELHISHVAVIHRRRRIAATALGLGIHL